MRKTSIFNFELEIMVRKALLLCMNFMRLNESPKLLDRPKENNDKKDDF